MDRCQLDFLSGPKDGLNSYVFEVTILVVKGSRLALLPIYLGTLYACLDECVAMLLARWIITTWLHMRTPSFFKCFFGALSGLDAKSIEYSATVSSKAEVASPRGDKNMYRARTVRWVDLKQSSKNPLLMSYIKRRNITLHLMCHTKGNSQS